MSIKLTKKQTLVVKIGALRKIPGEARSLEVIDFTYPETTNLFRQAMSTASEEDVETLRRAAEILGLNLSNNTQGDS